MDVRAAIEKHDVEDLIDNRAARPGVRLLDLPAEILELIFKDVFTFQDSYSLSDLVGYGEAVESSPGRRNGNPRLTLSSAWYAAALRPFLRRATLDCSTRRPWLRMPGPMSACIYSLDIEKMSSSKQSWVSSISCPLPIKGDYWSAWEGYLETVLRCLPNLHSLELTRFSAFSMESLRSSSNRCFPCTRIMEKAKWIDAVAAHPKLQRFLATSMEPSDIEKKQALKLRVYVQIRFMLRNGPRGIVRWTEGQGSRQGIEQFCRELRGNPELQLDARTLQFVVLVMGRVLELHGYEKVAEMYKKRLMELRETRLEGVVPHRNVGAAMIAPAAVAA